MPQLQDCISKIKIGDTLYKGFPPKLYKPRKLNAAKDIINLPDNVFSTMSSKASQAVKSTLQPANTNYYFPNSSTKLSVSECEMWNDIEKGLL